MSNKKITDLTELTTPTTDDVFPIVDIATNTTQKVQVGNLPIQTAVTTALATKQATLVSGTNIKTVNSTTLLGSGDIAVQPTLVSGTNIKTLNSVSLLGSGNIVLAATPSGVAGAIQFSNGSAFASDASNLFWDDTNNRLGVGTNAPTEKITAQTSTAADGISLRDASNPLALIGKWFDSSGFLDLSLNGTIYTRIQASQSYINTPITFGSATALSARLGIKGSGSTSATTSLLVQNSSGTEMLSVNDAGQVTLPTLIAGVVRGGFFNTQNNSFSVFQANNANGNARFYQFVSIGTTSDPVASAALDVVSTTKGFLPPRMTTTQKTNISSPAAGLVVYDSTTNKLCCYNGSTWNDLF